MKNENAGHFYSGPQSASEPPSAADIELWIIGQIAAELHVHPETIRAEQPILSCGIDSLQVVSLVAKLEDWLGFRFSGNPLEDHFSIIDLSRRAAELSAARNGEKRSPDNSGT
jgi:acyl carrier protein